MKQPTRERIVDCALGLAEQHSWEAVRLHQIATDLNLTLADIHAHFREKEDIVDAWFDRADAAMLAATARPEFETLGTRMRIERALMSWFAALAPHRRVTRQMVANKFEFGHVHYQFGGLLRVSRTVQWLREAAQQDATLPRRAVEEAVLTSIYLTTFAYWLRDDSADATRTRAFLERALTRAERVARALPFGRHSVAPVTDYRPTPPGSDAKTSP